jgi:hypothetical protein
MNSPAERRHPSAPPPGGPLPADFRHTIHKLAEQARAEDLKAEEELRKRAEKKPFSRFVWVGATLIVLQLALLAVLYMNGRKEAVRSKQALRTMLPANGCNATAYTTYWKIVSYIRAEGHPPAKLDDLIPKYMENLPFDPVSGKPLEYATDGQKIQLSCPGQHSARK